MSDHPAWDAYIQHVRGLHDAAGSPSIREVARRVTGRVSHTTVHDAIAGRRLPGWEVLSRVILAMNADPAEVKPLWKAAYDELHPVAPIPIAPRPMRDARVRPVEAEIIQQLSDIKIMVEKLVDRLP